MTLRWLPLLALVACSKGAPEEKPPSGPAPMSTAERQRGVKICEAYVARVCRCAEGDPELRDACELGKAQPEAVRMHLDVLDGAPLAQVTATGEAAPVTGAASGKRPPLNEGERRVTESSLRKVIAACVKLDAELDPGRCPRS